MLGVARFGVYSLIAMLALFSLACASNTPTEPTPTASPQLSPDQAKDRLRSYFDLRYSETDKKFEQFMKQRAGGGEMLIDGPNYDQSVVKVATEFTSEWEEWRTRRTSPMVTRQN